MCFSHNHNVCHSDCIEYIILVTKCFENVTGMMYLYRAQNRNTFNRKTSAGGPIDEHAINEGPPTGCYLTQLTSNKSYNKHRPRYPA